MAGKKTYVSDIAEAIKAHNQKTLFELPNSDSLKTTCIAYLKHEGYRIAEPIDYGNEINSMDGLINYFYALLDSKDNGHINAYRHLERDRIVAKRFIENRMKATGAKKEIAIEECGEIVKTVIENRKKFKFKFGVGFSIFGQAKLGWITDVAVNLINKKLDRIRKDEAALQREEMLRLEDTSESEYDLDAILSKMDEEIN